MACTALHCTAHLKSPLSTIYSVCSVALFAGFFRQQFFSISNGVRFRCARVQSVSQSAAPAARELLLQRALLSSLRRRRRRRLSDVRPPVAHYVLAVRSPVFIRTAAVFTCTLSRAVQCSVVVCGPCAAARWTRFRWRASTAARRWRSLRTRSTCSRRARAVRVAARCPTARSRRPTCTRSGSTCCANTATCSTPRSRSPLPATGRSRRCAQLSSSQLTFTSLAACVSLLRCIMNCS